MKLVKFEFLSLKSMNKHLAIGQAMHPAVQLHPAVPTVSRRKLMLKDQNQVAVQSSCFTGLCFLAISQWNKTQHCSFFFSGLLHPSSSEFKI